MILAQSSFIGNIVSSSLLHRSTVEWRSYFVAKHVVARYIVDRWSCQAIRSFNKIRSTVGNSTGPRQTDSVVSTTEQSSIHSNADTSQADRQQLFIYLNLFIRLSVLFQFVVSCFIVFFLVTEFIE